MFQAGVTLVSTKQSFLESHGNIYSLNIVSRFYFHSTTGSSFFANYLLWKNVLNISSKQIILPIFMSGLVNLSQSTRYYVLIDIRTCT